MQKVKGKIHKKEKHGFAPKSALLVRFQRAELPGINDHLSKGFTLIELLIVIAILGILASAIIFIVGRGHINKARDSVRKTNVRTITEALQVFYFDHGFQYPPLCDSGPTCPDEYTSEAGDEWIPDLAPIEIKNLPLDPTQAGIFKQLATMFKAYFQGAKDSIPQIPGTVHAVGPLSYAVEVWENSAAENDDKITCCDQYTWTGWLKMDSNVDSPDSAKQRYNAGFRFIGVDIPPGSNITSATLRLTTYTCYCSDGNPNVDIYAQAADDPDDFQTEQTVNLRPKTNASVPWVQPGLVPPGTERYVNWDVQITTPDISTVIQEIVNRGVSGNPGNWEQGDDLVVLLFGRDDEYQRFRVYGDGYHRIEYYHPKLSITYDLPISSSPAGSINANPTNVSSGGTSEITWLAEDVSSCDVTGSNGDSWSGTSGNETTSSLSDNTNYTLNCDGGLVNENVVVTVIGGGNPPSGSIGANPTQVAPTGTSLITWSTANVNNCSVKENGIDKWTGLTGSEMTSSLASPGPYIYSLYCDSGAVDEAVVVTIVGGSGGGSPSGNISANPTQVDSKGISTITWSTANVSSCSVSGDATGPWTGLSDSRSTSELTTNTTYNLYCDSGAVDKSVIVYITGGSGSGSGPCYYVYRVSEDRKSYALWACLEFLQDNNIYNVATTKYEICKTLQPDPFNGYNYCVGSQ